MKITDKFDSIRQQQPGQFRVSEDGKEPFVHVSDQKLDSTKDTKERSVYINNENVVTLDKDLRSDFPKLFDYEVGLKFNTKKVSATDREEKHHQRYDKTGKTQGLNKADGFIDHLAWYGLTGFDLNFGVSPQLASGHKGLRPGGNIAICGASVP